MNLPTPQAHAAERNELPVRGGRRSPVVVLVVGAILLGSSAARGQALGQASGFGALGGASITNSGATNITGSVGVYPGTAITGTGTFTLTGSVDEGGSGAQQGESDALSAYDAMILAPCTTNYSGVDLGTLTLTPGVYCFDDGAQLTGTLNLTWTDLLPPPFIFRIGTDLTTAAGSLVSPQMDDYSAAPVYWLVGGSAFIGANTGFTGGLVAQEDVTLGAGVTITCGEAIALNGTVGLDGNTIDDCLGGPQGTGGGGAVGYTLQFEGGALVTPEPSTLALLLGPTGVLLFGLVRRRRPAAGRASVRAS